MASRYYRLDDDRELVPDPVSLACEGCGRMFPAHPDDADDETRLCGRCVLAVARRPLTVGVEDVLDI